ncbi:MAG: alpha/beta hydrolase [Ktedonobacterales bacterium]
MASLKSIEIITPDVALEALLRLPDNAADTRMAALVCHPHPLGGGTMHNKVVFRIAQALGDLGLPVLRFNFRGVGRSTGSYDEGRGETTDVQAALDLLAHHFPGAELCLAGFSFGSWVGLPVGCGDGRVRQLIGVGVPVATSMTGTLGECTKHKLIVQGEQDQYGSPEKLVSWFQQLTEPKQLALVPGADHFFTNSQSELYNAIYDYFKDGRSVLGPLMG